MFYDLTFFWIAILECFAFAQKYCACRAADGGERNSSAAAKISA